MAKGGRYLDKSKNPKKKGKGLKVLVIVLIILGLLLGGGYFAFRTFMGSMLGNVNRAEFEDKNQDKTYDDLMADLYGAMDSGSVQQPEQEEGENDVYVPEDAQAPEQTTLAPEETVLETAG